MKVFLNIIKKVLLIILFMLIEFLIIVFLSIAIDPSSDGIWPVLTIMVLWLITIFLIGFPNLFVNLRNIYSKAKNSPNANSTSKVKSAPLEERLGSIEKLNKERQNKSAEQIRKEKILDKYQFEIFGQYLTADINLVGEKYDNRQEIIGTMTKDSKITYNFSTYNDKPCIEIKYDKKLIGYLPQEFVDLILPAKDFVKNVKIKSIFDYDGDLNVSIYFRVSKDAQDILENIGLYIDLDFYEEDEDVE